MTVLTKLKVSKHEDEPALTQLVASGNTEENAADSSAPPAGDDEVDAEAAARYRVLSQRARRINSSNMCACTALIAVLALCLLCGLFYYRHNRMERVHAWCSLPYDGETNNEDLLQASDAQLFGQQADSFMKPERRWPEADDLQMLPMFHEEFDIDLEDSTEEMFVPKFERGLGARFMAHFHLGEMVILPTDTRHCLTMELNRDDFLEPQALAAQVRRMQNGETLQEALSVRREVLTVRSVRTERQQLSAFTVRACAGRPAFALHRRLMFKRAAEEPTAAPANSLKLSVYAGRGLIEYVIMDLPPAE